MQRAPRRPVLLAAAAALGVILPAAPARGGPCERLTSGGEKALVATLLRTQHPYDCCDKTIAECLAQPKVCRLARRLRDDICRRVARGEGRDAIERALARRAETMTLLGRPATIDVSGAPVAGEAQVALTIYACARCPFCRKLGPEIYRAVTAGRLKGRVKLYWRIFPIRSHPGATPANLAFQAAHRLGAFWRFMLQAYTDFDGFTAEKPVAWAQAVGLDPAAFRQALADPAVREAVVKSKKEGIVNRVDATPTLFIDGRRYTADLKLEVIEDLADEEADRVAGREY